MTAVDVDITAVDLGLSGARAEVVITFGPVTVVICFVFGVIEDVSARRISAGEVD